MRYLLLLLFLAACTTTPTTYRQGAPMAPRAPAFEPAWTAPHTTGQPGYVGDPATAPRSPYSRVLPETPDTRREPGLWSAEGPKAVSDHSPARLFDAVLPFPPDADDDTRAIVQICADQMNYSAIRAGVRVDENKTCRAARLYLHCANGVKANYDKKKANGETLDQEFAARATAVQKEAAAMVKRECGDTANTPDGVVKEVAKTWDTITKGPPSYDAD